MKTMQRFRNFYWLTIHGRTRGVKSALLRGLLLAASGLYFMVTRTRELLYRIGLLRGARLPCKVISIGNITAGGTGKTPMVAWIARWLVQTGAKAGPSASKIRVAVLSRGYGKTADAGGDDEALIDVEGVDRYTSRRRASMARRILRERPYDVILLDDGFQHFRIRRDLDIVMVDATNPCSNGYLLPRGLLRERPRALKRANLIVITHADQIPPGHLEALKDRLEGWVHHRNFVEAFHRPVHIVNLISKRVHHLNWLKNRRVYAFCGIGNPESFRSTLDLIGADVVKFRSFPDHHPYAVQDIRRIQAEAAEFMADTLLTTQKDALRMDPFMFDSEVMALKVDLEIIHGESFLEEVLARLIQLRPASVNSGQAPASSLQE